MDRMGRMKRKDFLPRIARIFTNWERSGLVSVFFEPLMDANVLDLGRVALIGLGLVEISVD